VTQESSFIRVSQKANQSRIIVSFQQTRSAIRDLLRNGIILEVGRDPCKHVSSQTNDEPLLKGDGKLVLLVIGRGDVETDGK
jgi:hypothetical protein